MVCKFCNLWPNVSHHWVFTESRSHQLVSAITDVKLQTVTVIDTELNLVLKSSLQISLKIGIPHRLMRIVNLLDLLNIVQSHQTPRFFRAKIILRCEAVMVPLAIHLNLNRIEAYVMFKCKYSKIQATSRPATMSDTCSPLNTVHWIVSAGSMPPFEGRTSFKILFWNFLRFLIERRYQFKSIPSPAPVRFRVVLHFK